MLSYISFVPKEQFVGRKISTHPVSVLSEHLVRWKHSKAIYFGKLLNIKKGIAAVINTVLSYKVFRWNTIRAGLPATDKMFLPEHKASIIRNNAKECMEANYSSTCYTQDQENL